MDDKVKHVIDQVVNHLDGKYIQVPYRLADEDRVMLVNVYSISPAERRAAGFGFSADTVEEDDFHWN